ncbi:hypothetical protein BU16DRAFT_518033 [Lophium mytilinum]|uniref:DUF7580 domain-containing protein n=1 Tax=Lophium mytilinum TaxID=390894 RepID=A0A6A6QE97_9PEZI|nr:hypothetical protein BU16DRAFT_518033 [Lophium mytilinum]
MSGFEIAGAVLGSIPLIISALEHYADGVATIKSMKKYEGVFDDLHVSLITSLSIYRNSCEELLGPLALPDSQLYELLEKIDGSAWEDVGLSERLRERLGSNYLPFRTSVKQLNKRVVLFGQKLRLKQNFKPQWIDQNNIVDVRAREDFFKNPLTRVRGGFSADKYKLLLSEIDTNISRISILTAGAIALEPLRFERKRKANSKYWNSLRTQAEALYNSFFTRWSPQCACQHLHQANLRLDLRKERGIEQWSTFRFLFSFEVSARPTALPWHWRAVEIEPEGDEYHHPTAPRASKTPTFVLPPAPQRHTLWQKCALTAPKIDDLCKALKGHAQGMCCLGILSDAATKHHIHSITLPIPSRTAGKTVSLEEVLHGQSRNGFQIKENRCRIALTLATAVLQLHGTPWLSETWTMKDIYVVENSNNALLSDQPYVSKSFKPTPDSTPPHRKRLCFVKNSIIFALGVALLEISYGKPTSAFETTEDWDDDGKRTVWTEFSVAGRLADALRDRELANYFDAVHRCIHCNFDSSSYSLTDDHFRERFYQGVVVPLQKDYEYTTRQ